MRHDGIEYYDDRPNVTESGPCSQFDEICEIGALATLPKINIEMLRESSAEDGEETPVCVADAALAWLRALPPHVTVSAPRTHRDYFIVLRCKNYKQTLNDVSCCSWRSYVPAHTCCS